MSADPAPKLVPRPIPGLEMLQSIAEPDFKSPEPILKSPIVNVPTGTPDQAKVLYIHRRSTLPPELTKGLPVRNNEPMTSSHLQMKQSSVKIIPKKSVPDLANSKN